MLEALRRSLMTRYEYRIHRFSFELGWNENIIRYFMDYRYLDLTAEISSSSFIIGVDACEAFINA